MSSTSSKKAFEVPKVVGRGITESSENSNNSLNSRSRSSSVASTDSKPENPRIGSLYRVDTESSLHSQLMRERFDKIGTVYEIIRGVGRGSVCQVYLIKKRSSKIGGSSRSINIKRRSSLPSFIKTIQNSINSSTSALGQKNNAYNGHSMEFAMKEIDLKKIPSDKIEQLKNEVEILKNLDHQNIIKAYETFEEKSKLFVVMELCTGGDLTSRYPYTEDQVANITHQVLSAVSYIHRRGIIHRDIKLENIMFETTQSYRINLIDFGLSKKYYTSMSERVGTLYSMSPETLRGDYTTQADLWSIGVVSYMLLSNGTKPFGGQSSSDLVRCVLKGCYGLDPIAHVSELARDFLSNLLKVEPSERLTALSAKQHPWMLTHLTTEDSSDQALKKRVFEHLVNYANAGEFTKLALNVIAKRSSWKEIDELRKVFDEIDTENSGNVNLQEFKKALGGQYSDEDLESIFHSIDVNGNNEINYTEFLAAALETQFIEEYRLAEAFDLLDSDDSGYISKENLRGILGDDVDDEYIDELIAEADFFKDGRISYEEFLQVFNRHMEHVEEDKEEKDSSVWRGLLSSIRPGHRKQSP